MPIRRVSTSKNFLSLHMRCAYRCFGEASMIWHDVIKMETILFRPHWRISICNLCGDMRGTRVCVCVQVSTNLESPPIIGNWGVIGHLCLMNFILLKHIKKNGLEPTMGSGVRLCMGKMLGTSWHSLKTVTSLQVVFLYVCLAWMLV